MENIKTHICTENGTIEKLSTFDTIMKHPNDNTTILGFRDFGDGVDDMMLNIKSALCV